ncbi:ThiF family adenylyltransferase [Parasediminibacterium sp. JCM 36343]|uniref:ThiF family adenylyltransferase n=1 Tax=Parasediminibacterium sp. JCM 36343 TaxID=3374279 RepID=UPI00397B1624
MKNDIFKYPDTNSSRAKIDYLNYKFENQKIAIIGLGGTGSYILDFVSKTPVKEIHLFDGDTFQLHNAFRAPGATPTDKFDELDRLTKVGYYFEIYSNIHGGIIPHHKYVTKENIENLSGFDLVFISVDSNTARSEIINNLLSMNIAFIDVGLGVKIVDDHLIGTVRVTAGTNLKNDHLADRIGSMENEEENEYSTNIQIAELNCLNAVLAVIKWKKINGFYQDLKEEHNSLFFINTNKLINEDFAA